MTMFATFGIAYVVRRSLPHQKRRTRLLLIGLLLAGCSPAENGSPASGQGQPAGLRAGCDREYYVPAYGVGFDLPERASGFEILEVTPDKFSARWSDASLGFVVATLFSRPSVFDLEAEAEIEIALSSDILVASSPITLDSGQPGWVIRFVDSDLPADIFAVKAIVIGEEFTHTYSVIGNSLLGTNDFDALLRIARTLCAGTNTNVNENNNSNGSGVDPPTGHVPILFKNTARIADNVFRFIVQGNAVVRPLVVDELLRENPQLSRDEIEGLIQTIIDDDPVDLEGLSLPPRVRLTIAVVNVDGTVQRLEFLDGLRVVRAETGTGVGSDSLPVDLTEDTNDTFMVECDIDTIFIERIDVFVPVVLRRTAFLFDPDGRQVGEECISFQEPDFDDLEADGVFDPTQGEFGTRRDYDPRFFPPPLTTLQCGAVVTVELTGDLFLPFRDVPNECEPAVNPPANGLVPAFLFFDDDTIDKIPGRYSVTISVRS